MIEYPKPKWNALYRKHFPQDTDPCSRHVVLISEALRDKKHPLYPVVSQYDDPEHLAESMELTVISLWRARAALHKAGFVCRNGKWVQS